MSASAPLPLSLDALERTATRCESSLSEGALVWRRWGKGQSRPLLLLHGGFGSWTHWAANIADLQPDYTLWVPDLPGLGDSADFPVGASLDDFVQALSSSFDALAGSDTPFDIAGFSFGALIGAHWAARAGQRCRHLVACGAAGFGDLHVQVDLLRPPAAHADPREAADIHRHNLASLMLAYPGSIDDQAVDIHGDNLARSRFNSRRLARGEGFCQALQTIEAKLCGIWGAEDATAGGAQNIAARERLFRASQPDCPFHVLEGVGHWAMYEAPEDFNKLLRSALAD